MPRRHEIFPDIPPGLPFFYGTLASVWVFFPAAIDVLARFLAGTGLRVAPIDDGGLAGLNFQRYLASSDTELESTVEVEFNIVAYPVAREGTVPRLSLAEYVGGADTTKTIGNYRLHVACDDKVAIKYGKLFFGEPKFLATFKYNVPDLNAPDTTTWTVRCTEPARPRGEVFALRIADLGGRSAVPANGSEIVQYSVLNGRPVCSRWNIFGAARTVLLGRTGPSPVSLSLSPRSRHPMTADMRAILGRSPRAAAVQTYVSPPAASIGRPAYADL